MRVPQTQHRVEFENGVPRVWVDGFGDRFPEGLEVPRLLANGDSNTKTRKNVGYVSCGLSMSPHRSIGIGNVCTSASAGCVAGCLNDQGLASVFETIGYARKARTVLWYLERQWFLETLASDLERWQRKADRKGLELCARLNMFSDIQWERYGIPQGFPQVKFYDYTKHSKRAGELLPNYWVTFSRSETNHADCLNALKRGANVAVVFHDEGGKFVGNRSGRQRLPSSWRGFPVVDGDTTDLRFDDPRGKTRGRVVGLRLKAHDNATRAAIIESGFSVKVKR
ncbi:GP88 family protein [Aporhodopirellula aestuarii]